MSKLRWAKFFWADWSNDSALNLCSIPARGLWMSLLCLMAQGEPYGTLTIKGRAPSEDELRELCRMKPGPNAARNFRRWMDELTKNEVIVEVEIVPTDASGLHPRRVLSSSRMHHDGILSGKRSDASRERWKVAKNQASVQDLHMQTRPNGADLHMQTSHFASTEAEAEAEREGGIPPSTPFPPPTPPAKRRGGQVVSITQIKAKGGNDGA